MISKISFAGNVYLCGSTQYLTKGKELKALNKYANKNDCDVVVLNRDYYSDGTGKFSTLIVNENSSTGINTATPHFFDFKKMKIGSKTKIQLN